MTNGNVENVSPAPTVVIGVGKAGIGAMVALHDLVKGERKQEYFRFVAIDSHAKELKDDTRNVEADTISLDTPTTDVDLDKSECAYLYQGVKIPESGVSRQRAVGRYLIDNVRNFGRVYNTLDQVIDDHAQHHQDVLTSSDESSSMNIWLLHSLGGGTGSGTFSLLAALIQKITESVHKANNIDFFVGGVGCLPSMVKPPELVGLKGDPRYYANAFAAMRELEMILQCNSEDRLKINMHSSDENIDIEKSLFDKYFLIGINEDAITATKNEWIETYIEQKNNLIANCIYCLHTHELDPGNLPGQILGTFGEREIGVPIDLVKAYVNSKDKCSELRDAINQSNQALALWEKVVNELWAQYSMKNRGDEYRTAQSVAEKYELLIRSVEQRIESDENYIGNLPTFRFPGAEKECRKRLKKNNGMKKKLQSAKNDFDRIIELKGTISENEDNLKSEESRCSSIESDLSTSKFGRVGFLEMNNLQGLTASRLEGMGSFNDFITNGFVKKEDVGRALEKQTKRAREWSDLTEETTVRGASRDMAFILHSSENKNIAQTLPKSVRKLYGTLNYGIINDPYMIKTCVYKFGINIKNVRDYATLWDYYEKGKLADLVGMSKPIGEIFAYPEFFPDDENVRDVFVKLYK